jgi:hypothetical protein
VVHVRGVARIFSQGRDVSGGKTCQAETGGEIMKRPTVSTNGVAAKSAESDTAEFRKLQLQHWKDQDAMQRETNDLMRDANELKRIELQMKTDVTSRRGIQKVYRVSSHTVAEWERRGLEMMRPGTLESLCVLSVFQEFMARNESFPGVKSCPKKLRVKAVNVNA